MTSRRRTKRKDKELLTGEQKIALQYISDSQAECIIGIDEVGLGCWAGPVTVGAVVVPKSWSDERVKDSKMLTAKRRQEAGEVIRQEAKMFVLLSGTNEDIDSEGLYRVRDRLVEAAAVSCLLRFPDALIVQDGDTPSPVSNIPRDMVWLPAADVHVPAVSAASVLAKLHRDAFMVEQSRLHPEYGFASNKGYYAPQHFSALLNNGITKLHRRSFKPVRRFADRGTITPWPGTLQDKVSQWQAKQNETRD